MSGKIRIPQIIAIIVALIAIVSFFLPFISATKEYSEYLDLRADEKVYNSSDLKVGDMKNLSLFQYAKFYFQAGKEIYRDQGTGTFYAILIGAIVVFSILILLFALGKKAVPTIFFSALMGIIFYLINWDFTDRRIMPDSNRVWGIAHYIYYPIAIILLICGIWMLVEKKKAKRQASAS